LQEEGREAFESADSIHEQCMEGVIGDVVETEECRDEHPTGQTLEEEEDTNSEFDGGVLQESL
jgi:hypothetical protein